MRILLVSTGYPPDGSWGTETYTRELARGLSARGHELLVFHPVNAPPAPHAPREVRRDGIRVVQVQSAAAGPKRLRDSYENPGVERAFRAVLSDFRPDCVHFLHLLWMLSVNLPALAREAGVPTVLTLTDLGLLCHRGQRRDWRLESCDGRRTAAECARCIREPAPFDGPRARVLLKRWAVRSLAGLGGLGRVVTTADVELRSAVIARALSQVDLLIAPTRSLARAFAAAGLPAPRELVYAIDERPLRAARAVPLGDGVRIRFVGQFAPHKGPATLLRAAELLAARCPDRPWTVHLHGAPSPGRHARYAQELARRARGPRVHVEAAFAPFELARLLARTDVLVIPSEWMENAPLAALQARAAGVPVVASDVPGLREVLEVGRHGWFFRPGDAADLAARLETLVRDGPRRMPAAGLPMTLEQHLARLEELYAELASDALGPEPLVAAGAPPWTSPS